MHGYDYIPTARPASGIMARRMCIRAVIAIAAIVAAIPVSAAGDAVSRGGSLFLIHCAQCHGLTGKGDGSAAAFLPRKPRDFTQGIYKIKSSPPDIEIPRDEDLSGTISRGMSASGMPPWDKVLSEPERRDLVAYIKSLSDMFEGEANPPPLNMEGKAELTPESVARGREAYLRLKCDECHGPEGEGPSTKALKDDYGAPIWPRDLTRPSTYIGPFTREALYARITNGIPLTPMPPHPRHGEPDTIAQDRWDAVNYVFALAEQAERRRTMYWAAGIALAFLGAGAWLIRARRARKSP